MNSCTTLWCPTITFTLVHGVEELSMETDSLLHHKSNGYRNISISTESPTHMDGHIYSFSHYLDM